MTDWRIVTQARLSFSCDMLPSELELDWRDESRALLDSVSSVPLLSNMDLRFCFYRSCLSYCFPPRIYDTPVMTDRQTKAQESRYAKSIDNVEAGYVALCQGSTEMEFRCCTWHVLFFALLFILGTIGSQPCDLYITRSELEIAHSFLYVRHRGRYFSVDVSTLTECPRMTLRE